MSQQPEVVFRHGPCSAAIFANTCTRGQNQFTMRTVAFQRRFMDKDGKWQSTSSLRVNDIPRAILVLQKSFEYLTSNGSDREDEGEEQTPPAPQETPPSPNNGRTRNTRDEKIAQQQKNAIVNLCKQMGISEDQVEPLLRQRYKVSLDDLDFRQKANIIQKLRQEAGKRPA